MSFSSQIKEELSLTKTGADHCRMAETAAIITMCGGVQIGSDESLTLKIHTENRFVAARYCRLLAKAFQIRPLPGVRIGASSCLYSLGICDHHQVYRVLYGTHLLTDDGEIEEIMDEEKDPVLRRDCCRRAYLRGAFLVAGSVSDPRKHYHLEITCPSPEKAEKLRRLAEGFDLSPGVVERKGRYVFYLKEGDQISSMLGLMGASKSLMEMENVRILRDISNNVNRRVNCDAANIGKTVKTAQRQIEDIRFLREHTDITKLPAALLQMAQVRLEYPELPLLELGQQLDPPLGKSGVNHRLSKLSQMAQELRERMPES